MMIKKLLIGLCAIQAVKATTWITIKYFSDEACQDDLYGVGVYPAQCIVSGGRGITVSCNSNLGLVVNEYGTITCSDLIQNTSLITSAVTGCHSNINENEYYQQTSSGGSYLVDCMDNDDWTTDDDTGYKLTRTSTSLSAASAIDYTSDPCIENGASTSMSYCFLNDNGDSCLPTSANLCTSFTTMYAYTDRCISDVPSTGNSYYYQSKNEIGEFKKYDSSSCSSSTLIANDLPYSECLGCNRFKDLPNDTDTNLGVLAAWIVAVIVISVVIIICCGVALIWFGVAAVTAIICCCRARKSSDPMLNEGTPSSSYNAQPMSYSQPVSYGQELISILLPVNIVPGKDIMTVMKSNGQQVQFLVPPNAVPGSTIQVAV